LYNSLYDLEAACNLFINYSFCAPGVLT